MEAFEVGRVKGIESIAPRREMTEELNGLELIWVC
jgi:hypothetical protein